MVEPGDEYYLDMSLWKTVPFNFMLDSNTESMDITLQRTIMEQDLEECNSDVNYSYIGKRQFILYRIKYGYH